MQIESLKNIKCPKRYKQLKQKLQTENKFKNRKKKFKTPLVPVRITNQD